MVREQYQSCGPFKAISILIHSSPLSSFLYFSAALQGCADPGISFSVAAISASLLLCKTLSLLLGVSKQTIEQPGRAARKMEQ